MHDITTFLISHWVLTSLLGLTLLLIGLVELRFQRLGGSALSSQALVSAMNHEHAVVIDVREFSDYSNGHILGSVNIPAAQLEDKIDALLKKSGEGPVVLICQQGVSGANCAAILAKRKEKQGRKVNYLDGGITAWVQAGLPLHT